MNIRIISDMHIDVNAMKPLELKDRDTFTVVAGDVAGDPIVASAWLRDNVRNGIVVAGNHIVYNRRSMTIEDIREHFAKEMPVDGNLAYLDCLTKSGVFCKEVDGILFMGSTLYTDYGSNFYPAQKFQPIDDHVKQEMVEGRRFLNDFRFGRTSESFESDGSPTRLLPQHYLKWFRETLRKFDEKLTDVEKTCPQKQVVIVTHHCPSTKCIAPQYRDSSVNFSFVSDLEWFIEKHPSIRLWACGHVHNRFAVKVEQCLVVANPRGYCRAGEDKNWNQNLTVDSNTWQIINAAD